MGDGVEGRVGGEGAVDGRDGTGRNGTRWSD